jgi:DNA-directed RNA polymerase specialized sigma24 family protein
VHARLVDDMSYRDIGERLRIHETEAKDAFHSAIKRLRQAKRRFPSCLPE